MDVAAMTLTFPHDELCERSSLERSHPHFANYFTQCACANRALAKKDEEIKRVDESYLLVEEDKRLLKIELATAREEIARLTAENERLKEHIKTCHMGALLERAEAEVKRLQGLLDAH